MGQPPHILVVDDHAQIRESVTRYLVKNGMRATAAKDAAAARADRQRLKNERRALAKELQATRTALTASSKAPPPAPAPRSSPRPRASSSFEDPEDAVVLEMLGIC